MQENKIWCDCCKKPMDEPTASELNGQLGVEENEKTFNLDDICDVCAEVLSEAIQDVLLRRGPCRE